MTIKVVGKPELGSAIARTQALGEVVDRMWGPGTAKNVTGGHVGRTGAEKLLAFLNENANAVSQALNAPPPAAATPSRSTAAATAPSGPSRKQLEAIILAVEPLAATSRWSHWSDSEMLIEAERVCFTAHIYFPGMRPDTELAQEFWRRDASTITGSARYLRAQAAAKVKTVITKGK